MNRIILCISGAIMLAGCSNRNEKADAYGNFEAVETIVSSEGNGRLEQFSVEEGDVLEQGKLVGLVDTVPLYLKKAQLVAQKKLSASNYTNIQAQRDVQEEQKKNTIREKQRLENLVKDGAAPVKQLDDMNGNLNVINSQIASTETQRQMVADEINVFNKQIEQVNDQMAKCFIINPCKGTVLEKYAEHYELVSTGKPLYKIADIETLELTAYVSGSQLSSFRIGDTVKVQYDTGQGKLGTLSGELYWVSSKSEFTPKIIQTREERVNLVYAIKVRVKNNGDLKIGMPGEVRFK